MDFDQQYSKILKEEKRVNEFRQAACDINELVSGSAGISKRTAHLETDPEDEQAEIRRRIWKKLHSQRQPAERNLHQQAYQHSAGPW